MIEGLVLRNQDFDLSLSAQLDRRFMQAAKKISMLLACEGIRLKAYNEGLPLFSQASLERKAKIVRDVEFYQTLCIDQVSDGYKIKDNLSFTWRALSRLGLVPRSDLFQYMRDDHVVEVYSDENVQLFRNFTFYEFCSYTLEELHTLEWWSLYERDASITRTLFAHATDIFNGVITNNFVPDLSNHKVYEASSADKLGMEYGVDMMGPLLADKKPRALIILERARLI